MYPCNCRSPDAPPAAESFMIFDAEAGRDILLGRTGENLVRKIRFDISGWRSAFGDGGVQLAAKRSGREAPYLCVIEQDGDSVYWPITAADVAIPGNGSCELRYYAGGQRVKALAFRTVTMGGGICGPGAPPGGNPNQGYLDKMMRLGADAEQNAQRAENAATIAQQQAQSATEKASEAISSAASASAAADAAKEQAEVIQEKVTAAGDSAKDAAAAAEAASNAVSSAAEYAQNAEASAQSAQEAAANAQQIAGQIEGLDWPSEEELQEIWDNTVPEENTGSDEGSNT